MSTQPRTAPRGGKNSKLDSVSLTKSQKNDSKTDPPKSLDNPKAQPTAEQMRIAQIIDRRTDDAKLKEKIRQIIDATRKTEDEVITALHDCDNDLDSAVNMLLEGEAQGEWETSGKRKKNRQANNVKGGDGSNNKSGGEDDLEEESTVPAASGDIRERSRNRGGGPPRLRGRGGNENRNWRGRENKENEQNNEDGYNRSRGEGGYRRGGRGMSNGPGGRSGRGGRSGGRLGPRTFQSRDKSGASFPRSIETWNNPPGPDASGESNLKMENWGDDFTPEDWDNEEYTGSLADSKVFTPSGGTEPTSVAPETLQNSSNQEILMSNTAQDYHQSGQLPPSPLPVGVGTLNAAQSQYLSQLTSQSENLKSAVGIGSGSSSFGQNASSTYGPNAASSSGYGQTDALKSVVGSSVSYNQSSTYPSSAGSYGPSTGNGSSYGPSSGTGSTGFGQTTGYGQSGQTSYATGSTSSGGYGQTTSGYGQTVSSATNYGQQSQNSYGQSVGNSSAFQSQPNASAYGQAGSGMTNSGSYQTGSTANSYSGTSGSGTSYQGSGSNAGVYQSSAGSGNGGSYQTSGTGNSSGGSYPGTGSQGTSSNSASQNVNYQGAAVSGSNYSGTPGGGPGGISSYQSGSSAFHSGSQPSVFTSQNYNNSAVNTYGSQLSDGSATGSDAGQSSQPVRTKTQRARVPPPSKIPQSAVEMPDDSINASISFLDVQFGGLEFGSEGSAFEGSGSGTSASTATETASTPTTTDTQNSALDGYSTASGSSVKNNQATLVNALAAKSVQLTNNEALSMQSSEHKASFSTPSSRVASSSSGLDLSKSDVGLSYSAPSSVNYQSYQSQKNSSSGTGVYQQTGYATGSYASAPQVTSSSASYAAANQSQSNNYGNQSTANNSFPNSSYSQTPNAGVINYPNTGSGYQGSNSFSSTNQPYQSSGQSVYGSSLSSGYSSANQYQNSYGGSVNSTQNKLNSALTSSTKDSQEYAAATTVASLTSAANSGLSNAALTCVAQTVNATTTKVSNATTKSSVVANIPPGVPPIMSHSHQYIMSQGGLPYFQPPTMYSFEELQVLQQRIPHMATGYYDMAYQAPTSLATGRDSMGSVAYTMSDARYTRGDNNASPVPSTLSQQTATQPHQQPMMNHPSLPPGYAYFYGTAGMMPGSFQYGTPALYPLPAATNAHGSTTSQYPKPGSYSAYGSGYDGLSQSQDYAKSAYVSTMSTNQAQTKSGVGGVTSGSSASTTSDLNASMYGKSHTALGKVNSYEKQGFHSGTPPPFNLAGNQNTGMAPSGAYGPQLFIPTMAPHQQHHSATLMHQPLHQDSGSNTGPRTQSSTQSNKSGSKQNYNAYWSQNMN